MESEKKRILIVDDEEDLTWSISRKLKNQSYLEVLCANSGQSALELLAQYNFDLLVTDLRMPGISGIKLLSEVKSRYPRIQVIIMTAYGSADIKSIIEKWDQTGYIEKPFEINDLRKLIYACLYHDIDGENRDTNFSRAGNQ